LLLLSQPTLQHRKPGLVLRFFLLLLDFLVITRVFGLDLGEIAPCLELADDQQLLYLGRRKTFE